MQYNFFIITRPSFEDLAEKELIKKWPHYWPDQNYNLTKVNGGLEISSELVPGLSLNQILRSANRVLLRIKEQKCSDLPKLYKILKKIPWKDYLVQEKVDWHITCHESRLMHTGRIEKTASDALSDFFSASHLSQKTLDKYKDKPRGQVFLRFQQDLLTISIDTSGELLYHRGDHEYKGHAPLRNNYAYLFYEWLMNNETDDYNFIDPMCGSGALLKEIRDADLLNNKRVFQYQDFPLLKATELNLTQALTSNSKLLIGQDLDTNIISRGQKIDQIQMIHHDLFSKEKLTYPLNDLKWAVIVNPPYGKKIKIAGDRIDFYNNMLTHISRKINPHLFGFMVPVELFNKITIPNSYKLVGQKKFNNNGINLYLVKLVKN